MARQIETIPVIEKTFPASPSKELGDIQAAMLQGKTDEAYTKGLDILTAEVSQDVPENANILATILMCPSMDEDLSITVVNELSFDGGATWWFFNSFTRTPEPWIGYGGKPDPITSIISVLPEKMPAGVLKRTKIIRSKDIDLKLDYGFGEEAKAFVEPHHSIAFVQNIKTMVSNTTAATSATFTSTTGNLFVVSSNIWRGAGAVTLTFTDSKGNTWAANTSSPQDPPGILSRTQQEYSKNITGGTLHTVTATSTQSATYIVFYVHEFSGAHTTAPFDKGAGAVGTGTTQNSGVTATRSQANEVLVVTGGGDNAGSVTTYVAGSGFTIPTNGSELSSNVSASEYKIVSAAGTDAGIFTTNESTGWACIIGTYKEATAGGGFFSRHYYDKAGVGNV